jgi:hypothetical protein
LWTTPPGGWLGVDGGELIAVEPLGAGVTGARAGEACVWVAGFGRGLSAGIGPPASSAGTDARGAWTETGGARDGADCGAELVFVAIPRPKAAANNTAAVAAASQRRFCALCDSGVLNMDVRQFVVGPV